MASRNRGKSKTKLRDLSRIEPSDEELYAQLDAVYQGDSTTAAIIGAALIEHQLENLLRAHFPHNSAEIWRELTSDAGPLGTMQKKLILAKAFLACDDATLYNIEIIRKIRNVFAHTKTPLKFDHNLIISELQKTKCPAKQAEYIKNAYKNIARADNPRIDFAFLCEYVTSELVQRGVRRTQRKKYKLKKQVISAKKHYEEMARIFLKEDLE